MASDSTCHLVPPSAGIDSLLFKLRPFANSLQGEACVMHFPRVNEKGEHRTHYRYFTTHVGSKVRLCSPCFIRCKACINVPRHLPHLPDQKSPSASNMRLYASPYPKPKSSRTLAAKPLDKTQSPLYVRSPWSTGKRPGLCRPSRRQSATAQCPR